MIIFDNIIEKKCIISFISSFAFSLLLRIKPANNIDFNQLLEVSTFMNIWLNLYHEECWKKKPIFCLLFT